MPRTKTKTFAQSTANIGFEAKLWLAADKLRNNMDAAEYKHVVLGLIFLKYISDTFEEHRTKLLAGVGDYAGANPEDPDEYKAENVFWVPAEARWAQLQANAKQPTIGKAVDDAMVAIEIDKVRLKGGNAGHGWAEHFSHHFEQQSMAGFVLANGRMFPNQSGGGDNHRVCNEAYLMDSMIVCLCQLYYGTQIKACLWFLLKTRRTVTKRDLGDRSKHSKLIDARKLGTLIDRVHHVLTEADLYKIISKYHTA
ncbi:MAG: type I restriction-modification system subunit M N-terminal domain-containing protein [Ignavibacteriae bacterium]|nr:type I restriction-modification system subunit M N-terminal domain-containing protein [Ignavibacteriota bacterium]